MNIWLIRHGLDYPGCKEGRYQGFLDESLSEKGKRQLTEAARSLVMSTSRRQNAHGRPLRSSFPEQNRSAFPVYGK